MDNGLGDGTGIKQVKKEPMKKFKIEIKWAIIFVVMVLLWMLGERLSGLHSTHIDKHPTYTMLIAIPAILVYVFALLDKKKNFYNGRMTFLQAFSTGISITIIVTLLSPLLQFLTFTIITPEYFTNAINHSIATNQATKEEAEAFFNLKNYIKISFLNTPMTGVMTTLMVSAVVAIISLFQEERRRGLLKK